MSSLVPKDGAERRRHGRVICDGTETQYGEVMDLSASGLRVCRKGGCDLNTGDELAIRLWVGETEVDTKVRVVHTEKAGFRKHLIGFEFTDLDDCQRTSISRLAQHATKRLVLKI